MSQGNTAAQKGFTELYAKDGKFVTSANIIKDAKLCQLLGPDSWLIPRKLNAKVDFHEMLAKDWSNELSLKITKNCAEGSASDQ